MTGAQIGGAFAALLVLALVFFGLMPLWWMKRGYPKWLPPPIPFTVTPEDGLGGAVVYREGDDEYRFSWELTGQGPSVAFVYLPDEERWPVVLPWAADRRDDVIDRIAKEVKRQRCPACRIDIRENVIEFFQR